MNAIEDSNLNNQPGLAPILVKPKQYLFDVPPGLWLVFLAMSCFSFYISLESFFSTGSIWGAVFILAIPISLLYIWLSRKERKRRAVFLEAYQFPSAQGLKVAWLYACKWEAIDQQSPSRLPFLFALDAVLAIPDGFKHPLDNDYATEGADAAAGGGCGGGFGGGC